MEKILLAMEGDRQNTYAVDFACYLAKLTGSGLTGIFLEGGLEHPTEDRQITVGAGQQATLTVDKASQEIRRFREACLCRQVVSRVHRDRGLPLSEILLESRFSDLIVVDPETSFKPSNEFPGRIVRDILHSSECPVVLSPYTFTSLDKVIFTYDGSASSVFAIKQFTYLFPSFRDKEAVVVSVREDAEKAVKEQFKIKEWFAAHYQRVTYEVLSGDASDELFGYLLEKKDTMVVLGAYGRGVVSRFFKPSHAGLLLKTVNLPLFITHR